jgi:hypothetical protein
MGDRIVVKGSSIRSRLARAGSGRTQGWKK